MNLLIISNADSCRSRIAQALLSSFGKGMKVYSAGTMPAAEIHPLVLKLIKETGIEPNTQPPHSILLSGTADDIRNLFRKEVKHWYHLPFEDLFSTAAPSEAELWDRLIRLKEDIQRKMYELYRDDLREQVLPRCSCGANDFCRCE